MIAGCQTIKEKTDAIVEKENEKLSKYISKPASVLQMDLGKPDEDFKNEKGNLEFGKYWYNRFMKSDAVMGPTESHEFLKQFVKHEYNVSRTDSSSN